jgi:signal peptidase II
VKDGAAAEMKTEVFPRRRHRLLPTAIVLGLTVGCDQVTKQIARTELRTEPRQSFLADTFRLDYAENPGAFLGLGGTLPGSLQFWLLTIGVGGLLLAMLVYLLWSRNLHTAPSIGLAMMVAGGLSNWFDRLMNEGRVVDFLNLGIGSLRTGIFNVADVAIMAGAAVLVFGSSKPRRDPPARSTATVEPGEGPGAQRGPSP